MAMNFEPVAISTKEDYKLGGPVKWCAGCGGHAVLSTVMNVLPETKKRPLTKGRFLRLTLWIVAVMRLDRGRPQPWG